MNRPAPLIWAAYLVCLLVAGLGLAWLTARVTELDRAETLGRLRAEQEEDVGRVIWRIDAELAGPILAAEAARPVESYLAPPTPRPAGPTPTDGPPDVVRARFHLREGEPLTLSAPAGPTKVAGLAETVAFDAIRGRLPDADEPPRPLLLARRPLPAVSPGGALASQVADGPQQAAAYRQTAFLENSFTEPPGSPAADGPGRAVSTGSKSRYADDLASRNALLQNQAYQQRIVQLDEVQAGNRSTSQSPVSAIETDDLQQAEGIQSLNAGPPALPPPATVREGVSRPLWLGGTLVVARRVELDDEPFLQGVVLDWPRLKGWLEASAADVLPGATLTPVDDPGDVPAGRLLATVPARLDVRPPRVDVAWDSPARLALGTAWLAFFAAAAAAAVLLGGVLRLAERRAAFVSTVTHELRTPLTTVRMYAEMLEEGMVVAEADRRDYLRVLRREADRLDRLVENVLTYARLERRRRAAVPVAQAGAALWRDVTGRLADRLSTTGLTLAKAVTPDAEAVTVRTDAGIVEQILFNLVDNAAKYADRPGGRVTLTLAVDRRRDALVFRIADDGPGLAAGAWRRPAFGRPAEEAARSKPGVGLGLPLSRRLARAIGGRLLHRRDLTPGTTFELVLPLAARP